MIRVLYAEDDPQVAEMVQLYFSVHRGSCTLDTVDSGRGCLAAMERGGYDVLIVDLMMPDLTGLQVLGELASRRDSTPVIIASGLGQHELAVRALRAGAVDCIDKNSADFRRIPEIALHAHNRHRRRQQSTAATPIAREHRVLLLAPDAAERAMIAQFIAANAPRLRVTPETPAALANFLRGETAFDAVVLGSNIDATDMLDALRHLRARDDDIPVIVVSAIDDNETTIAAFKLGAHDFLLRKQGFLTELVFSLNNALKRADSERLAARLAGELAELNRSLSDQVAARTAQLEKEIAIRREAELRAEDNAARMQSLSTRLLRVQEDERRSLAQELHDQIGQLLTGLRFQIESARAVSANPTLGEALALTDDLLQSVRALTLQLRPRMLDDLGLQPALEWQTNLFQRQTGIAIELDLSLPAARLSPELETAVFRMVQEALTNVARHSGANAAVVTVTSGDDALQVEISDRGRGFDAKGGLARHDSLGLAGLAERVRLAGGRFELFSRAGHGTRLHAEFALSGLKTTVR